MAATESTMMQLGTPAPHFNLPDPNGTMHSMAEFSEAPVFVVMFICNHCPFVKHIADGLAEFGREYKRKGVAIVAINSNDVEKYPDDAPDKMASEAATRGYVFPYLYDETQQVAKAYGASCTPDFFVFDENRRLAYRGQFCDSRPNNGVPVTGEDLKKACDALLNATQPPEHQKPSIGCNIKWKPGNAPSYFDS